MLVTSGYGAAFRVGRHLASGQVVVLLRGPHEFDEWYYPLLTPWVDYVPVRLDDDEAPLVAALLRTQAAALDAQRDALAALAAKVDALLDHRRPPAADDGQEFLPGA